MFRLDMNFRKVPKLVQLLGTHAHQLINNYLITTNKQQTKTKQFAHSKTNANQKHESKQIGAIRKHERTIKQTKEQMIKRSKVMKGNIKHSFSNFYSFICF